MCTIGTIVSSFAVREPWSILISVVSIVLCHLPVFALVNTVVGGGVLSLPYSFQLAVSTPTSQNHENAPIIKGSPPSLSSVKMPTS